VSITAEAAAGGQEAIVAAPAGRWRETIANVLHQRSARIGLAILLFFALVAILAPVIAPFDPQQDFIGEPGASTRAAPCIHILGCPDEYQEHWFGLDGNGRDLLSRVIYGTQISLVIGFLTVGVAIVIGATLGAIAGYAGGRVDTLIMRLMDVLLVFPALLLAISLVTFLGRGLVNAALAIGLVAIPIYARIMRASVLTTREQDYVVASRALGETSGQLLLRRVLPNSMTAMLVAGTLGIGTAVLDIAALSFLGLVADARVPEWGAMLGNERNSVFNAPHLLIFPGLALTLMVLAYNLFGDGLRDALDPRLQR
jgi:ABC-type dipeptide/oligopeptide/nickel transport system permease subunit